MMRMPQRQRGVALLVALLVVALAVILIAALLDRGELALARTRNVLRAEQAEAYSIGLDTYAAQVLTATIADRPDTNASKWALPLPPQAVPGGVIGATRRDLNGCFNLNNLAPTALNAAQWAPAFDRLLGALALDPGLHSAIVGWLDTTKATQTELNFYLSQPVPYRPRGGLFAHVSELRLVRGVTSEVYARLAPHVCALPPNSLINVNTATVPVLIALTGATQAIAESLWQNGAAHWEEPGGLAEQLTQLGGHMIDPSVSQLLTIQSNFFLVRADITLDTVPFTFYSVIERRLGSSSPGVRVLARSRGSDVALTTAAPLAAAGEDDAGAH
jgi:general secretion pathway protein K